MTEPERDTQRAVSAAKLIIDERDLSADSSAILVTLEHHIALVLLAVMDQNPTKAAAMLNEGLVAGVEDRLALAAARPAR